MRIKKKKTRTIMFVLNHAYPGDKQYANIKRISRFIEGLATKGHKIFVIVPGKSEKIEKIPSNNIFVQTLKITNIRYYRNFEYEQILVNKGIELVKAINPDYIIVNNPITAKFAKIVNETDLGKIIWDVMGLIHLEKTVKKNNFINRLLSKYYINRELLLSKHSHIIITINDQHTKIIKSVYNRKAICIRDATELMKHHKKNKSKVITIVFSGGISNRRLDEIFTALKKIKRNFKFSIIGDGGDLKYYKKYVQNEKNLKNKVMFSGYLSQKENNEKLLRAKIGYSDDWSEIGFPVKVFEYMSAGLPVVVKRTAAVEEIINDGLNGLLYSDTTELSASIAKLIDSSELREILGNRGREEIKKHHTWKKRILQLNSIIKKK